MPCEDPLVIVSVYIEGRHLVLLNALTPFHEFQRIALTCKAKLLRFRQIILPGKLNFVQVDCAGKDKQRPEPQAMPLTYCFCISGTVRSPRMTM